MTRDPAFPSARSASIRDPLVVCAASVCLAFLVALFLVPYPPPTTGPGMDAAAMDGGGMEGAVPDPGTDASPDGGVPGGTAPERFTEQVLTKRILERPLALWSMILLRFATAVAGFVVLILFLTRRSDARKGLVPPTPVRPLAVMPFSAISALGLVVLWALIAPGMLSLGVHALRGGGDTPVPDAISLLSMCVTSLPIAVWIVLRARSQRALQATDTAPLTQSLKLGGLAFLVSAAVVLVIQIASGLVLTEVLGEPPELQRIVQKAVESPSPLDAILITVLGVVVAPFAEEAVYRGMLYPAMRALIGMRWAAVSVSAVFAASHMNLWAAFPLFGLALLLTWCYERTGSILAGVLVHAASNAASLIPILLLR